MALGDGATWDETAPTDATSAVTIDDHNRDLRVGVRGRMAREHEWPSSQNATNEAGAHKFITLQAQTAKPTLAGTQVNAIYASTDNFYFEKSDGTVVQIVSGTELNINTASFMTLTDNQTASGTKTFASVILANSGINLGGSSVVNGLLGRSSAAALTFTANGTTQSAPAGYYIYGIARGGGGEVDGFLYAKL